MIGIDSGLIKFRNLDNHLFGIGDAIVWANRMSSAGLKGDIILNNIPYHKIKAQQIDIEFETIENTTTGGESFTASRCSKFRRALRLEIKPVCDWISFFAMSLQKLGV